MINETIRLVEATMATPISSEYPDCDSYLIKYHFGDDFIFYAIASWREGVFIPREHCFNCEDCKCTVEQIKQSYSEMIVIAWSHLDC